MKVMPNIVIIIIIIIESITMDIITCNYIFNADMILHR
jgi:hypothetical protein